METLTEVRPERSLSVLLKDVLRVQEIKTHNVNDSIVVVCIRDGYPALIFTGTVSAWESYELMLENVDDEEEVDYEHFGIKRHGIDTQLRHKGLVYKNFRVVDGSHINRLFKLTRIQIDYTEIDGDIPVLQGMAYLPYGFVVERGYNKTVNAGTFDVELGKKYLKEDIEKRVDEELWRLEGYRLYRNVNTLDAIIGESLADDQTAVKRIANGGIAVHHGDKTFVVTEGDCYTDAIRTSDRELSCGVSMMPYEAYIKVKAITDTYIERT